jgi:hypothetical protein
MKSLMVFIFCLFSLTAHAGDMGIMNSVNADPARFNIVPVRNTLPVVFFNGSFDQNASSRFDKFTIGLPAGTKIIMNSTGGSVQQALAIGRIIRARKFTTVVGRVNDIGSSNPSLAGGTCGSACTFAFLGGTIRALANNSQFRIHQPIIETETDPVVSQSHIQNTVAMILEYCVEMGINPIFVATSIKVLYSTTQMVDETVLLKWSVINARYD